MSEECQIRIANLLASLDNLERNNVDGKIAILAECIELQAKQIQSLRQYQEDVDEVLEDMEKENPT